MCSNLFRYCIKQKDSMLPCVCSVIDHRRRQNVVRTSVTHSAIAWCATFLLLPHFDVICDLLLNRRTATCNLFGNYCIYRGSHISPSWFSCGSSFFFPDQNGVWKSYYMFYVRRLSELEHQPTLFPAILSLINTFSNYFVMLFYLQRI